ncbi:MAG: OsmC family protein [Clostridia bacterium]|nr:OsmC family protein [Clostridia bacterium]
MAVQEIKIKFGNGFNGELIAKNGTVAVGGTEGTLAPYDMLLGSLAACLYSTFLDVVEKKRIVFDGADVTVTGEKRNEIPTTLKYVKVTIEVRDVSDEKGVLKAAGLATKYCSVYETISKVADIDLEVKFIK